MDIVYIILGWLLGLLTSPLALRIERKYRQKDYKFAIFSELKIFAARSNMVFFKIRKHLGTLDKSSLEWIVKTYKQYDPDINQELINVTKELLETSDEEFENKMNRFKAAENISLGLKTFSLPLTDSLLENISILDSEFQRKILEIKAQVDMLNQEIENSKYYFNLTFNPESLSINKDVLRTNIKSSYNMIQEKCKYIVGLISEITNSK